MKLANEVSDSITEILAPDIIEVFIIRQVFVNAMNAIRALIRIPITKTRQSLLSLKYTL